VKPITFSCSADLDIAPNRVAEQILNLDLWPGFEGYGLLPGIRSAEFEVCTPEVVGTRIRVVNTDGSSHVEEVVEWEPGRRLRLRMGDFSPPLAQLASRFDETWQFEWIGGVTRAIRSFDLHPRSSAALADLDPAQAGDFPTPVPDASGRQPS
jgi:hypothetical protein